MFAFHQIRINKIEEMFKEPVSYTKLIKGENVELTFDQFMTYYKLNPGRYRLGPCSIVCTDEDKEYRISFGKKDYNRYVNWLTKTKLAEIEKDETLNKLKIMEDVEDLILKKVI